MTVPTIAVLVTRADGGVTVLHFVTEDRRAGWTRLATREAVDEEIARSHWAPGEEPLSWRFADTDDVPTDRTYRDAWMDRGQGLGIGHDMTKARALHRDHLRRLRAPILAELDAEYLRADEDNDNQKKQAVRDRKRALRDVTADPAIDAAATVEQLKVAGMGVIQAPNP
jgi:hypothetical protein